MGESLKRPPVGFDPNHTYIEDLKRKDFAISVPLTEKQVVAADFMETALDAFRMTKPFVNFLAEAVGLTIR
jgi:uncharacterized protein (DUF2461 family)